MSEKIKNNVIKEILRGSISATVLSVLFVLIFALLARFFSFSADLVPTINTIIKILSVFFAVALFTKLKEKGFAKGVLIAVGFLILSNLIFVFLGGQIEFKRLFFDLFICSLAGIIGGVIAVNRKK